MSSCGNLLLGANASITRDDFEGINRTDYVYRAGFGARYLWNRYFTLSADYSFRKRDSEAGGNDYTENVIGLTGRIQY